MTLALFLLTALAADPDQPGIVRATALELLRPLGQTGIAAARTALNAPAATRPLS